MVANAWKHQNKEWQKTFDMARIRGWSAPQVTSNHPTWILQCPGNDPHCEIRAFSTGNGGDTVAIQARKIIRNCPHSDETTRIVAQIDELLTGAARMIAALATILDRDDADKRATELLDLVEQNLSKVDTLSIEGRFDEAMEDYYEMNARASKAIEVLDLHGQQLSEKHFLQVESSLTLAEKKIRKDIPKRSTDRQGLHERYVSLRGKYDEQHERFHDERSCP